MFERFTEQARRVIFFARYEASHLGSSYVETEHLLLGLLRQDKELANRFLHSHAAVDSIRKQIEGRPAIREKVSTSVDLPLSGACKRALAYTAQEAANQSNIATEHILLGLLQVDDCLAAELLREHGLSLASVREELHNWRRMPIHKDHQPPFIFTLTALYPKLTKADPSNRTGFHEGPGLDGTDPRIANPAVQRLVTCQNMTMAQFAESLPEIAPGYIGAGKVVDATRIEGEWDFTLSFSVAGMRGWGGLQRWTSELPNKSGSITLFEALETQLGLKLEKSGHRDA